MMSVFPVTCSPTLVPVPPCYLPLMLSTLLQALHSLTAFTSFLFLLLPTRSPPHCCLPSVGTLAPFCLPPGHGAAVVVVVVAPAPVPGLSQSELRLGLGLLQPLPLLLCLEREAGTVTEDAEAAGKRDDGDRGSGVGRSKYHVKAGRKATAAACPTPYTSIQGKDIFPPYFMGGGD